MFFSSRLNNPDKSSDSLQSHAGCSFKFDIFVNDRFFSQIHLQNDAAFEFFAEKKGC